MQNRHIAKQTRSLAGQAGLSAAVRWSRTMGMIGLAAGLTACSSAPYHGDDGQVWPPAQMRPVSIAIAPPIDRSSVSPLDEGRSARQGRVADRQSLVRCVWQQGAQLLAQQAIPGTEISTHLFGRWALGPSDRWVSCTTDSSGWSCVLTDEQVNDFARRHDISHLVVPRRFSVLTPDPADSSVILFAADVAVIDPLERRVIWTGSVAANRQDLLAFDGLTPPLTALEQATYTWLVALFRKFDRIEVWPEEDLGALARCCQELPPVFDWPEESPADVSQIAP